MKTKLLILLILAGSSLFAKTRVFANVGIGHGGYGGYGYGPPVYAYVAPPPPSYVWAPGYWEPVAPSYYYRDSYYGDGYYYSRPSYVRTRWIAPRNYYRRDYYRRHWRR